MSFEQEFKRWTERVTDPELKGELDKLARDDEKRELYFSAPLEFGTAGLRGVMTAGINAMNIYTVAQATQGFADYINKAAPDKKRIVIGYDCRIHSLDFARTAAAVMAENGIKVFLFDELRPTPVLSFGVRYLDCTAGINVTASHNPKQYNGYKAYWADGAQIGPEQAEAIEECIKSADIFDGVKIGDFDALLSSGMIEYVGEKVDEAYLGEVLKQRVNPDAIPAVADELKIVYTPLHGTGYRLIPECLKRAGLKHLIKVEPQFVIDGSFPTVDFPNPEYPAVFKIGIELANESGSDLIIATDPDADRTGIMARNRNGEFVAFTGNQVGALLLEYIANAMEEQGPMPDDAYAIKTIVSTELVSAICKAHKITLHNVLTGFKYIGEVIGRYEAEGRGHYLLGFEESYGYLRGSYARDKDAVVATLLLTELAAGMKARGKTLCDALDDIYSKYGCYREGVDNIYMEGLDGAERMARLMDILRADPPKEIAGSPVRFVRDYVKQTITDLKTGDVQPTNLPVSNVLYFETEDDDVTVIRPSGTEPKIKLYYLMHADTFEEDDRMIAEAKELFGGYVKRV